MIDLEFLLKQRWFSAIIFVQGESSSLADFLYIRDRAKTEFVATSELCPLRGGGGRRGPLIMLFVYFFVYFFFSLFCDGWPL